MPSLFRFVFLTLASVFLAVPLLFLSVESEASIFKTPEKKLSVRPQRLSPFQSKINECFKGQVDVKDLLQLKKLYIQIVSSFNLHSSETIFREVVYMQKNEKRKLRYENGVVTIFRIEDDEKAVVLSEEKLSGTTKSTTNDSLRYKTKSLEAQLDQLLTSAQIKSDFIKTTEYRSKQLTLNLVWSDGAIKNLTAQFADEKNKLECQRKDLIDICDCHN